MIPILGQKLELEALGDACYVPGLGDRLEAAHDQSPDFLLVIDVTIGVTHDRQVGMHTGNRPRHQIEVFRGEHGHIHARKSAELARPLAGAVHDRLAAHLALMVGRAITRTCDATPLDDQAGDPRALDDPRAAHARTLGERLRQIGRIGLAVARNPHCAAEIIGAQERIDPASFARGDEFEFDAEALGSRHLPLEELQPIGCLGDVEAATLFPAGRQARLAFQRCIELDAIAAHAGGVACRAELTDQARSVPGRAAGELALLEQYDVRDAELRQMVRRRRAHDSAADDDDPSVAGNGVAHGTISDL